MSNYTTELCNDCVSLGNEERIISAHGQGLHVRDFVDSYVRLDGKRVTFLNSTITSKPHA